MAAAYTLRGRLRFLVGSLVAFVLAGAAATVATSVSAGDAIAEEHAMQLAFRRAGHIAVLVREQYIHEAHTMILRDRSHLGHHNLWVGKLGQELDGLEAMVPAAERGDVEAIREASAELLAIFSNEVLPAVDRGELAALRRAHDRANALVDHMTGRADALASSFEKRADAAEDRARSVARAAGVASAALALASALLALLAGRSLWRAFAAPLDALGSVARRVAAGDRQARVGPLPATELALVGDAFDTMLDELGRAEAELVAAERLAAIGRIAAGVAHEINNPIAVIRGYVKEMRREFIGDELASELAIVDEEAAACQRIAEDLLVYVRTPAIAPERVQADELLREAVQRLDGLGAGDVGSPRIIVEAEAAPILVDPVRIRQIVTNLIVNAQHAATLAREEAGAAGEEPVVVRGSCRGDGYQIEVLDRGAGVGEELRERIFEPFFTTRRTGTGLGLAVCYGIAKAHGGAIVAEPRPGGGTRFVVDLPDVIVREHDPGATP